MMPRTEADYLITTDGKTYPLQSYGWRAVLADNGRGIPTITYQTARGYKQHGVTVRDYRLEARIISLQFYDAACGRQDLWDRRYKLIDILRPNRGGPMTLRKVMPNGTRRDIQCWLQAGADFSGEAPNTLLRAAEAPLQLLCPDPSFYDPALVSTLLTASTTGELTFPITFDTDGIVFETSDFVSSSIAYTGTWRSYPIIVITGPYSWVRVENQTVGANFTLTVGQAPGAVITVDLTPGAQTVTDAGGNVLYGHFSADSNLVDWYLAADPEAAGGVNVISADAGGRDASTSVTVRYYTRYIGL